MSQGYRSGPVVKELANVQSSEPEFFLILTDAKQGTPEMGCKTRAV